jgi:N-acetylmuramic acid 6-phosphate (MurNAc-6-P) etherase
MEIDPASLTAIIGVSTAAVTSGILGVLKVMKRNGKAAPKTCQEHNAVCNRLAVGDEHFKQLHEKLDDQGEKLDEQREMIHSTSLDIKEMSTIVKMLHKD